MGLSTFMVVISVFCILVFVVIESCDNKDGYKSKNDNNKDDFTLV